MRERGKERGKKRERVGEYEAVGGGNAFEVVVSGNAVVGKESRRRCCYDLGVTIEQRVRQ